MPFLRDAEYTYASRVTLLLCINSTKPVQEPLRVRVMTIVIQFGHTKLVEGMPLVFHFCTCEVVIEGEGS